MARGDKVTMPQCLRCKHYIIGRTCEAFKDIPAKLFDGSRLHDKPYKGDNGIQYEPLQKVK